MHPEVKHADKVVLATERRDLMLENLQPWELIKGIAPMAEFIAPLEPRELGACSLIATPKSCGLHWP